MILQFNDEASEEMKARITKLEREKGINRLFAHWTDLEPLIGIDLAAKKAPKIDG